MFPNPQRGSLILLVMCLLAVLGIALASYLAVSNQAMKLSNRAYQTGVSEQLAEMGLEEALRAFNNNSWSNWTASDGTTFVWSTSGTTASCTITLPSTKYGTSGVTGTVSIRVDNYNSAQLSSAWSSSSVGYKINDLVGLSSDGIWYRCLANHTSSTSNQPPNLAYWAEAPIPWKWSGDITYSQYSLVNYNGTWYRCHNSAGSTNNTPPNSTYWTSIPSLALSWSSSTSYSRGAIVFSSGSWYYSINNSNTGHNPPNSTWWAALPVPTANTYNSSTYYNIGDYVYYSPTSSWYRCVSAGVGGGSWSMGSTPLISWMYRSGASYAFNDVVYYSTSGAGTWYRCKVNSTSNVPTTTSDWEAALSGPMHAWNSGSINYNLGDAVYYATTGQWYRCILAHTSSSSLTPSNTTYWSNSPLFSTLWDSGRQYSQYDTVRYNGVWYLSLQSNNTNRNPSTTSGYWIGADTTNASYIWNSTTSYSAGAYRCYGGVWYKCLSGGTNRSPNNSSYWTASWANSWGITTGAPVIYSEGRATLPDGTSTIKTQLRATIAPAPLFPNAAGAASSLTITSGTGTVNSYNSVTDPTASSPGYSAVLAAGSTLAINGTTAVSGYLAWPSPPAGISTDTTVYGPSSPVSPKVDPAQVSRSPYIPQFDCLPRPTLSSAFSSANFPEGTQITDPGSTGNTLNLGTPGATIPSRYYYYSTTYSNYLRVGTSYPYSIININGPVILYVRSNLRIQSDGVLNINSTGSAEIHVNGGIRSDAGGSGGGYNNRTLDPKKLVLISDVSNTSTHWQASATNNFYGVIYTPNTTATLGLDIRTGVQIYGAVSAKNVYFRNEATVHYDTSLRYAVIPGVDQPWAIAEWRELTDSTDRAVLP